MSRTIKTQAPDEQTAGKYLLSLTSRRLHHDPGALPPIDSSHLFGNARPLELEIGCGTGEFLCALAAREPAVNFVGVDLHTKSLHKAVGIAAARPLENITFVNADFRLMAPRLTPASLRAIYLHFPDPNVARRFRKRRIFTARFLDLAHSALIAGGRLSVMTDHRAYFLEMLALAEGDARFERTHRERYLLGFDAVAKSRFQRIWEGHGLPTLRFELRKSVLGDGKEGGSTFG